MVNINTFKCITTKKWEKCTMYNIQRQKHFPSHIYQYNNDYFDNKKLVLYFTYTFPQFTINIFSYEPFNGVIRKKI